MFVTDRECFCNCLVNDYSTENTDWRIKFVLVSIAWASSRSLNWFYYLSYPLSEYKIRAHWKICTAHISLHGLFELCSATRQLKDLANSFFFVSLEAFCLTQNRLFWMTFGQDINFWVLWVPNMYLRNTEIHYIAILNTFSYRLKTEFFLLTIHFVHQTIATVQYTIWGNVTCSSRSLIQTPNSRTTKDGIALHMCFVPVHSHICSNGHSAFFNPQRLL